jgi:hypothetical protein
MAVSVVLYPYDSDTSCDIPHLSNEYILLQKDEREREIGGLSRRDRRAAPSRQRPEAGGRGLRGAAMPRCWSEQGMGREADQWGPGIVEGGGG